MAKNRVYAKGSWTIIASCALAAGVIWTPYALWAEHQLHAWRQTHPGPLPGSDGAIKSFPDWAQYFGLLVFVFLGKLSPLSLFERKRRERILTGRKVARPILLAHALFGCLGVSAALFAGTKAIDRYQWLNDPTFLARTQAELSLRSGPAFDFLKPEALRFTKTALGTFLGLAFVVAALSANVVRQAAGEARFAGYASRHEERAAIAAARREQAAADEESFRVKSRRVSRRTLRYLAISWALFTLIMLGLWKINLANSQDQTFSFTMLAVVGLSGSVMASAFLTACQVRLRWRILAALCLLGSAGALALIWVQSGGTEHELVIIGAAFGAVCGSILGMMMRTKCGGAIGIAITGQNTSPKPIRVSNKPTR